MHAKHSACSHFVLLVRLLHAKWITTQTTSRHSKPHANTQACIKYKNFHYTCEIPSLNDLILWCLCDCCTQNGFVQKQTTNNAIKQCKPHLRVQTCIKYNESRGVCNRTCARIMMWFVCVIVSKQNLVTATNIKKNIKIARARERERQRERQRDRERETEKECEIRDFMHYLP